MARKKSEATEPHPLVAIDMGGHSVRAMAAERTEEGLFRILGVESSNRFPCVERGVVSNQSNAGYIIGEIMKLLANRIHHPLLTKAFVSLGGRSMKIASVMSKRDQVRQKEIPQHLLDEMEQECKQKIESRNPGVAVLDLLPSHYVLDGKEQDEEPRPEQRAALIEVHYIAFVGKKELEQKVLDSFIRTPKHIEHAYVRPDALLSALATAEDLRKGCAILDMGAQTTTLSIYKGNQFLYTKVISQGGYDISRDIEQLGISLAYAERLKCQFGCAMAEQVTVTHCYRVPEASAPEGYVAVRAVDLASIIEARLDQIVLPLMSDLNQFVDRIGVLYITGGGSMVNGMEAYLQHKTSIPVMYGSHAPWLTHDSPDEVCAPNYASLVGTLILGAGYRDEHPMEEPEDDLLKRLKKLKNKLEEDTVDIFGGLDNDNL